MNDPSIAELLMRTNDLLTVLAKASLRETMSVELTDPKKRKLFELTGGSATVRQLSSQLGWGIGTISRIWQSWEQTGLVVKRDGEYRRVIE